MIKILVIDDSTLMRKIAREHLEGAGFEVDDLSPTTSSALINRLSVAPPDLVITDFNMPTLNGEGVVRAVRFSNPKTPIIVMTANRDEARDAKLRTMGVRKIIHKPLDEKALIHAVKQIQTQMG
ncbi:MAG: response regulator [Acidobacteria bacterium]|nr:response regulator [Acidobacteriota bacterium]MBI3487136.1 response regulator [Acidobacteriota bacterium]